MTEKESSTQNINVNVTNATPVIGIICLVLGLISIFFLSFILSPITILK